jgi:hypothetical protein
MQNKYSKISSFGHKIENFESEKIKKIFANVLATGNKNTFKNYKKLDTSYSKTHDLSDKKIISPEKDLSSPSKSLLRKSAWYDRRK